MESLFSLLVSKEKALAAAAEMEESRKNLTQHVDRAVEAAIIKRISDEKSREQYVKSHLVEISDLKSSLVKKYDGELGRRIEMLYEMVA